MYKYCQNNEIDYTLDLRQECLVIMACLGMRHTKMGLPRMLLVMIPMRDNFQICIVLYHIISWQRVKHAFLEFDPW